MYFMGIDCGTQGTKVVIFDSKTGNILSKGYEKHAIISDDTGKREQKVSWWTNAMLQAMKTAIARAEIDGKSIKAISISGQQHGLVVMDKDMKVIRNVKLWNDTSTTSDNEEIIQRIGGSKKVWEYLHTTLPVGYTASKIHYLATKEPELFHKVKHVILPHDYLNYFLTGNIATEESEASGTGYYDVASRTYSEILIDAIDPSGILEKAIPPIIRWEDCVGTLKPDLAQELGMSPETLVAAGGGDNTMSAIGTGTIIEGNCSISLGTSGTVIINSPTLGKTMDKLIQIYDILGNKWLATTCTQNATSATSTIQEVFGTTIAEFDSLMASSPAGSDGVRVLPFFGGERMPPLPYAKGSITHLTSNNFSRANVIRATAEAVVFTLRWGYDKLTETLPTPKSLIINGGGANSQPWRQIVADVFDLPVFSLKNDEGGALGAALQAMYLFECKQGNHVSLSELCTKYIALDHFRDCFPLSENVKIYKQVFASYKQEVKQLWNIQI